MSEEFHNWYSIFARMSAESFKKMEAAVEEIRQQKPVSELSKEIYKYFSKENHLSPSTFCDDYFYGIDENNVTHVNQRKNYVDFVINNVLFTDGKTAELIYEIFELALKQDNNYDLIVVSSKDGSISRGIYNSGTFIDSQLHKDVNEERARKICERMSFLIAENQLRTGVKLPSTADSEEYNRLAEELRKIKKDTPECIPDESEYEQLNEIAKVRAKSKVCEQNNILPCYSFKQVQGLMASRRETQPKSIQR